VGRAAVADALTMRFHRAMRLVLVTLLLLAPAARAVDCGRLPTGQNPTWQELDAEIARASSAHGVPTEIIKGIAMQESGVQQWRPDGSFVHNVTDCGLGMMQLTGATARQFDVERLKDDWRYNLDCGVTVLRQKWDRAQREGKVDADPETRRVLENWYYAIAYYWGRSTEEYLRKIYGHIERRPAALQQLLRRPVDITIPSEAIPGFTFGDRFKALPGDRMEDKDGRVHEVPTHLGTIGDAEQLAQLDVLITRARRAVEREQPKKAIEYLRRVIDANLDTEHRAQAEALLGEVNAQGERVLGEAQAQVEQGDAAGARRTLRRVVRDFEGLPVVAQAQECLSMLEPTPATPAPDGD
jgi:hypothetical protein